MAAKKATRKKTARKKTARKKAARKTTGRKKATAKKGARKKSARKKAAALLGSELPKSLSAFSKQLKKDLNTIERHIESAGKGAGRNLARVIRDASHQLGKLEARGQKEWRARSRKVEKDLQNLAKRVRKATGVG